MSLIYLSCAWVAGIFLGLKFNLPLAFIFTGLIPLPLLFFRQHRKLIILTSLCLIAFFGGIFRFQSSLPTVNENYLQFYNNQTIEIKGIVNSDPEIKEKTTHIRLSATAVRLDKEWQEISGTALLFLPRYPAYHYGDVLLVTGELESPSQLNDFDYKDCVVTIVSSSTGSTPIISMF